MSSILPIDVVVSGQSKERFIDQCRGLKGMACTFPAETAAGNLTQIRHQEFKEPTLDVPVTGTPLLQQQRDLSGAGFHSIPTRSVGQLYAQPRRRGVLNRPSFQISKTFFQNWRGVP